MFAFIVQIIVALVLSAAATLIQQALAKRPEQPRKAGVRGEIQVGGDNPLACILGRYATAGLFEYANTWGTPGGVPNCKYVKVVSVSDLPVRGLAGFFVDGSRVTFGDTPDPDMGYPVLEYRKGAKDFLWVKFYDGSQTAPDAYLRDKFGSDPERPWLADMIGRGVAYFIATAHVNREFFPQFPEYLAEVDGIPLDDPRAGGPAHDNPAVGIRTVLLGLEYDGAWFYGPQGIGEHHLIDFEAQMDKCDAAIALDGGGTEKRFRFGYELAVDEEPHVVIAELLEACSGRIAEVGGRYRLLAGEPGEPVVSFTDDDIVISEGQTTDPFPGLEETHNAITATYPEPAEAWGLKDAPPRYSSALEATDDGRRLPFAAEFRAVPHALQVQRLMRAMIEEGRRFRRHSFTAPPEWWQYEPLDVVAWQSARNQYDGKRFLLTVLEDLPTANQVVGLQEIDPADYQWVSDYELPYDLTPVVIRRPDAQPMAGWQALPYTFVDAVSNARRPGIEVRFAGQLDDVRAVRIQVRLASSLAVVFDGECPYDPLIEAPSAILHGVFLPATDYEARGRFVPYSARDTEWSAWLAVTTPDTRLSQADLDQHVGALLDRVAGQVTDRLNQMRADLDEMAVALNTQAAALWERGGQQLISIGARYQQNQAAITQVAIAAADADSAQAALITGLDSRLTTAEGDITGNATAITGLDTRVTTAEGTITSQATAITGLDSRLTSAETGVSANATAISGLDTRVTATEGSISSQAAAITAINSQLTINTSSIAGNAHSLNSLGTLVSQHGALIQAQADAVTQVQADVGAVSAEGLHQMVAVASSDDALAVIEERVRAEAGGLVAVAGRRMLVYANADGTISSIQDFYADQIRFGMLSDGNFLPLVETGIVNDAPGVVLNNAFIADGSIGGKMMAVGAASTIVYLDDEDQARTYNAWNNSGAGEELSTVNFALVGNGVVVVDLFVLVQTDQSLVNSTGHFICIEANGVEVRRRDLFGAGFTAANFGFHLKAVLTGLPSGTNQLVGKLRLNDTGTGGTDVATVSDINWLIVEHHKPAVQAGGAADATRSHRATLTTPGTASDPIYEDVDLGSGASNLRILLKAGFFSQTNTVTGVSVGGAPAEKLKGFIVTNSAQQLQFWEVTYAAGGTADVVVTTSGIGVNDLVIVVEAITTAAEAPIGIVTANVNPGVSPRDLPDLKIDKGGVVSWICYSRDRNTMSMAWSGADSPAEDVEADIGTSNRHYQAGGFLTTESTTDDNLTMTSSAVGGNNGAFGVIAVSFR